VSVKQDGTNAKKWEDIPYWQSPTFLAEVRIWTKAPASEWDHYTPNVCYYDARS
jgi:hypothetical protein